jgi:hypothetical protein
MCFACAILTPLLAAKRTVRMLLCETQLQRRRLGRRTRPTGCGLTTWCVGPLWNGNTETQANEIHILFAGLQHNADEAGCVLVELLLVVPDAGFVAHRSLI